MKSKVEKLIIKYKEEYKIHSDQLVLYKKLSKFESNILRAELNLYSDIIQELEAILNEETVSEVVICPQCKGSYLSIGEEITFCNTCENWWSNSGE